MFAWICLTFDPDGHSGSEPYLLEQGVVSSSFRGIVSVSYHRINVLIPVFLTNHCTIFYMTVSLLSLSTKGRALSEVLFL